MAPRGSGDISSYGPPLHMDHYCDSYPFDPAQDGMEFPGFSANPNPSGVIVFGDRAIDHGTHASPTWLQQGQHQLLFVSSLKTRTWVTIQFMMPLSHETLPLGWQEGGVICDDQVVHLDFDLAFVEASVDLNNVANHSSSLSGS